MTVIGLASAEFELPRSGSKPTRNMPRTGICSGNASAKQRPREAHVLPAMDQMSVADAAAAGICVPAPKLEEALAYIRLGVWLSNQVAACSLPEHVAGNGLCIKLALRKCPSPASWL